MAEDYALSVLKVSLAQICQNIGWHAVQTTPMNSLIEIMHRYMMNMCKVTHQYAEHYNRTEPNLDDLEMAFKDFGVSLAELEEYVNNVEPVPFVHPVPRFPVANTNKFHFPKEGSKEVQNRPEWFLPHLPVAYPELEEEENSRSPSAASEGKVFFDGTTSVAADSYSPPGSPRPGAARRPMELTPETNYATPKRPRLHSDEEGRPMREVMSVTMTAAGLISPVREGRLPDTCAPYGGFEDSRPNSPIADPEEEEDGSTPPSPVAPPEMSGVPSTSVTQPEHKSSSSSARKSLSSRFKKLNKDKFIKKIRVKKASKENKKRSLKEGGKTKRKDGSSSHKSSKPGKIRKDRTDKSPRRSSDSREGRPSKSSSKLAKLTSKLSKAARAPKGPKIPRLPKVPRLPKFAKPKVPKSKSGNKSGEITTTDGGSTLSSDGARSPASAKPRPPGSKSPKGAKSPKAKKPRLPKAERPVAGGQLASLLAKAGAASMKSDKTPSTLGGGSGECAPSNNREGWEGGAPSVKSERPETPSVGDSPARLVIELEDGSAASGGGDLRLAALDECISAVIQRGMKDKSASRASVSSSTGSSHAVNTVEYLPQYLPTAVKLEPRDVYDFTDDEDAPGLSKPHRPADRGPAPPPSPSPLPPPPAPTAHHLSEERVRGDKKSKKRQHQGSSERRSKKQKAGKRRRSDSIGGGHQPPPSDDFRPRTPDTDDSASRADSASFRSFHQHHNPGPSLHQQPYYPLPHIPPALLPFPIPTYGGVSPASPGVAQVPYPKLADLADVAINKARIEGDFDGGKLYREKSGGVKPKKEKRKEKERGDRVKPKKKKEKIKEKSSGGGSDKGSSERDRGSDKGGKSNSGGGGGGGGGSSSSKKDKSSNAPKSKDKKEKGEKRRDKEKRDKSREKDKDKEKEKEKQAGDKKSDKKKRDKLLKKEKLEKVREDPESGTASPSVVPRLTFKLGSSGAVAEGTKIVIKTMANPDSPLPPSSSHHAPREAPPPPSPSPPPRAPSPVTHQSPPPPPPASLPPITTAAPGKSSHTKAGSSAAKAGHQGSAGASSSTPTRSVVTETIGTIIDESGNKIWICPACTHPDDGSPMIGCDECDEWYHWVCVGIVVPPKEEENWFCTRCIARKQSSAKRRKHRKDK